MPSSWYGSYQSVWYQRRDRGPSWWFWLNTDDPNDDGTVTSFHAEDPYYVHVHHHTRLSLLPSLVNQIHENRQSKYHRELKKLHITGTINAHHECATRIRDHNTPHFTLLKNASFLFRSTEGNDVKPQIEWVLSIQKSDDLYITKCFDPDHHTSLFGDPYTVPIRRCGEHLWQSTASSSRLTSLNKFRLELLCRTQLLVNLDRPSLTLRMHIRLLVFAFPLANCLDVTSVATLIPLFKTLWSGRFLTFSNFLISSSDRRRLLRLWWNVWLECRDPSIVQIGLSVHPFIYCELSSGPYGTTSSGASLYQNSGKCFPRQSFPRLRTCHLQLSDTRKIPSSYAAINWAQEITSCSGKVLPWYWIWSNLCRMTTIMSMIELKIAAPMFIGHQPARLRVPAQAGNIKDLIYAYMSTLLQVQSAHESQRQISNPFYSFRRPKPVSKTSL